MVDMVVTAVTEGMVDTEDMEATDTDVGDVTQNLFPHLTSLPWTAPFSYKPFKILNSAITENKMFSLQTFNRVLQIAYDYFARSIGQPFITQTNEVVRI